MAKRIRSTMNISLPAAQKRYVEKLVSSGKFQSASEVVRQSLRESELRTAKAAALAKKIEAGRRALDRGDHITITEMIRRWDDRDAAANRKTIARRRKSA